LKKGSIPEDSGTHNMDLLPSAEQQQIVDACIQFLEKEHPVDRLHKVNDSIPLINRSLLGKMADLGWFGLALSEEQGGVGYSLKEETLLFVELGRFLVSPAVLGSVLGARVAALSGNTALAEKIISGEKLVGVAISDYLFEAVDADLILIADEEGVSLIEKSSLGKIEKIPCMDEKVQLERVLLKKVKPVAMVSSSTENIYLRGVLLTAAMQLGMAQATLDRSVAYAKVREQYGKPIGAFQAIKHYCAEMAVKCESVMSMVYHGAVTFSEFDIVATKLLASEAAQHNANTAVQIHGGMGFTQEMDIHLFVKRAHVLDQLFGGKRQQAARLISLNSPAL